MKSCPNCGKKISEYALSCPFCGRSTTGSEKTDYSTIEQKTVINESPAKVYKKIAVATLFSAVAALLCFVAFLGGYSIYGQDMRSALITSGGMIFLRSVIVLAVSCVVFMLLSRSKKLNTMGAFIIATILFAAVHFVMLYSIRVDTDGLYAWLYYLIKTIIPVFAIVLGIGVSVLQGCLCIISCNGKDKFPFGSFGIVVVAFLAFSSIGILVGGRVLQQGAIGGMWGLLGTIAAIIATVIICVKRT